MLIKSEIEKIVFLDIDGVLQPKKSHLSISNLDLFNKIMSGLSKDFSRQEKIEKEKEYYLKASFEKYAIDLINRLIEKSGAKIVIISNWRKNIGADKTKEKLIKEGIKKEYFHEKFFCDYKVSSEKVEEINFWLNENRIKKMPERPEIKMFSECTDSEWDEYQDKQKKFHDDFYDYGIDYIVIDDDSSLSYFSGDISDRLVLTDYDEGFNVQSYRIALGMLNGHDKDYYIVPVDNDFISIAEKYIKKPEIYEYFYSIENKRKYPLCYLISEENAKYLKNDKSYLFLNVPKETRSLEEIRKSWLDYVEKELYSKYGNKHKLIYDDIFEIREGSTFNGEAINFECAVEDSAKKTPFIITRLDENRKPVYYYAPDEVENPYDFLYGYLEAIKKNNSK